MYHIFFSARPALVNANCTCSTNMYDWACDNQPCKQKNCQFFICSHNSITICINTKKCLSSLITPHSKESVTMQELNSVSSMVDVTTFRPF